MVIVCKDIDWLFISGHSQYLLRAGESDDKQEVMEGEGMVKRQVVWRRDALRYDDVKSM